MSSTASFLSSRFKKLNISLNFFLIYVVISVIHFFLSPIFFLSATTIVYFVVVLKLLLLFFNTNSFINNFPEYKASHLFDHDSCNAKNSNLESINGFRNRFAFGFRNILAIVVKNRSANLVLALRRT